MKIRLTKILNLFRGYLSIYTPHQNCLGFFLCKNIHLKFTVNRKLLVLCTRKLRGLSHLWKLSICSMFVRELWNIKTPFGGIYLKLDHYNIIRNNFLLTYYLFHFTITVKMTSDLNTATVGLLSKTCLHFWTSAWLLANCYVPIC